MLIFLCSLHFGIRASKFLRSSAGKAIGEMGQREEPEAARRGVGELARLLQ